MGIERFEDLRSWQEARELSINNLDRQIASRSSSGLGPRRMVR
jgi:hypothetical protein